MLHAVSNPDDSYAQIPGGAGRWTLIPEETGLENMAQMYHTVSLLANDITLYTTLQGITMQLLIIRLIRVLSAQKRLSILTSTAIKACLLLGCLQLDFIPVWLLHEVADPVMLDCLTARSKSVCLLRY